MTHQERVAANFPPGSIEHEVALFHDDLEDDLGPVPDAIYPHVLVLTRCGETYKDYIESVRDSGDRVAIAVKIADVRDNLARCNGEHGGYHNSNLATRYRYALKVLATVSE